MNVRTLLETCGTGLPDRQTHPDTRLSEVLAHMQHDHLTQMKVVEHGKLLGILNREDVERALSTEVGRETTRDVPVGQTSVGWEPKGARSPVGVVS